jgi:hypothetical protein
MTSFPNYLEEALLCPSLGKFRMKLLEATAANKQCVIDSCGVMWCWECKLIMNTSALYSDRAKTQHTAACTAPVVVAKKGTSGYKSVSKPVGDGGSRYRAGWDRDEGFIGTGQEY